MMTRAEAINERIRYHVRQLSLAAGGVETIGQLLQRRYCSADLDNITERDLEGLSLALQSLAYAELVVVGEIDSAVDDLEKLQGGKA